MSSDPSPAPALVICSVSGSLLKACRVTIVSFTRDGQSTARAPAPWPRPGQTAATTATPTTRRPRSPRRHALRTPPQPPLRHRPPLRTRRRPPPLAVVVEPSASVVFPSPRRPRGWREDWISREEGAVGQHLWCEVKFLNSKNSFKARP